MIDIKVISLESTPERLEAFRKQNSHLNYSIFPAIDGTLISDADRKKFIDTSYSYRSGALGNALSHQTLWNEVISKGEPLTICEDDAIFHKNFDILSGKVLSLLNYDWDICLWGWNFDSILFCNLPQGLSNCSMTFDQNALRKNFSNYIASDITPYPLKLLQCFGTICYSISLKGARNFLAQTQPIKRMNVSFPALNKELENIALDISMNAFYAKNESFASFPPLVVTKNNVEISTVQQAKPKQIRLYT